MRICVIPLHLYGRSPCYNSNFAETRAAQEGRRVREMQNVPVAASTPQPGRHRTANLKETQANGGQAHRHGKNEGVERLPLVQLHLGVQERSGYHGAAGARCQVLPASEIVPRDLS